MTRDELREALLERPLKSLMEEALSIKRTYYGDRIFIRGLIEVSNYCTQDCYYCGIRASHSIQRYRLTAKEIISACKKGYEVGFRTFVMQGGEDPHLSDEFLVPILRYLKENYPDTAVTLSLGERSMESYQRLFLAGADRYLLRHETIDKRHFSKLHPAWQSLKTRVEKLHELREIGYQTGCGIMVGSPYQEIDHLVEDLLFMREFKPHMVGIGPFIPHHETIFKDEPAGDLEMTLRMLALTRILLPDVLLPATTALATLDPRGRELGLACGANVLMPNLSPPESREKYNLYDGKAQAPGEAAEALQRLKVELDKLGHHMVVARGDHPSKENYEHTL